MRKEILKHIVLLFICWVLFIHSYAQNTPHKNMLTRDNYYLVWNDEFNGTTLDATKWIRTYPNGQTTNGVKKKCECGQIYNSIAKPDMVSVSNGSLKLSIAPLSTPVIDSTICCGWCNDNTCTLDTCKKYNFYYKSGVVTSRMKIDACNNDSLKEKEALLYGMIEARIRIPKGRGPYAAFWLIPPSGNSSWPPEIDIFEYDGYRNNLLFTTIWQWLTGNNVQGRSRFYWHNEVHNPIPNYASLSEEFHKYSLVWTPTKISMFIDDLEIFTESQYPTTNDTSRVCKFPNMDICLSNLPTNVNEYCNSSCSVSYVNNPNFSDYLEVDYVRVYKPNNGNYNLNYQVSNQIDNLKTGTQICTPNNATVSSVCATQDDVFFVKNSNLFFINWLNNAVQITTTNDVNNLITARTDGDEKYVFYRTKNGYLKMLYKPVAGIWSSTLLSAAGVVSNNLKVFENKIYYTSGGNAYEYFFATNTYRTVISDNTVHLINGSIGMNADKCFYQPTTGSNILKMKTLTGGIWGASEALPNVNNLRTTASPCITINGDRVYYIGNNNRLYYYQISSGITGSPKQLNQDNNANNIIQAANVQSDIIVESGNQKIYYRGTDNRIWMFYLTGGNDSYYYLTPLKWTGGDLTMQNTNSSSVNGLLYSCNVAFSKYWEPYFSNKNDRTLNKFAWGNTSNLNPPIDPLAFGGLCGIGNPFNAYPRLSQPQAPEKFNVIKDIKVYPNPFDNHVNFSSNSRINRIEFFDLNGKIISEKRNIANYEVSIDMSEIGTTNYRTIVAKIICDNFVETKFLIKK